MFTEGRTLAEKRILYVRYVWLCVGMYIQGKSFLFRRTDVATFTRIYNFLRFLFYLKHDLFIYAEY